MQQQNQQQYNGMNGYGQSHSSQQQPGSQQRGGPMASMAAMNSMNPMAQMASLGMGGMQGMQPGNMMATMGGMNNKMAAMQQQQAAGMGGYPRRLAPYPSPAVHMTQKRQQQQQQTGYPAGFNPAGAQYPGNLINFK